jgi:hypothetical protein
LVREIVGYDTATPTLLTLTSTPSLAGDGASCSTAPSRFLAAIDDDDSATPIATDTGGTTASVLPNDLAAGAAVVAADVTVSVISDGGLTGATIASDGRVAVPAGSAAGTYDIRYQVCLVASPTVCDLATLAVALQAPAPPVAPPVTPPVLPAAPDTPLLPPTGTSITIPAVVGGIAVLAGGLAVLRARRYGSPRPVDHVTVQTSRR